MLEKIIVHCFPLYSLYCKVCQVMTNVLPKLEYIISKCVIMLTLSDGIITCTLSICKLYLAIYVNLSPLY